jgi:hypothetical protein
MVMVEDTETRRRRLRLLEAVRQTFLRIADFGASRALQVKNPFDIRGFALHFCYQGSKITCFLAAATV